MLSFENSNDGRIEQKKEEKKRKKKKNNVKKLYTEGDDVSEFNSRSNRSMDILEKTFIRKFVLTRSTRHRKSKGVPGENQFFYNAYPFIQALFARNYRIPMIVRTFTSCTLNALHRIGRN